MFAVWLKQKRLKSQAGLGSPLPCRSVLPQQDSPLLTWPHVIVLHPVRQSMKQIVSKQLASTSV